MNFVLDLLERHEPMFWLFGILIAALALNKIRLGDTKTGPKAPQVGPDPEFLAHRFPHSDDPATDERPMPYVHESHGQAFAHGSTYHSQS